MKIIIFLFPSEKEKLGLVFFLFYFFLFVLFLMLRGSCHLRMVDDIGEKSND